MLQLITDLPSTKFVYGKLELPAADVPIETMWDQVMAKLALSNSHSSVEVRHTAQQYLEGNTRFHGSPLMHLFTQDYANKKLVLFWDEFDNAYAPERKKVVSKSLREIQNEAITESLSAFQVMVLFGSYNANLVTSLGGGSNFHPREPRFHPPRDQGPLSPV